MSVVIIGEIELVPSYRKKYVTRLQVLAKDRYDSRPGDPYCVLVFYEPSIGESVVNIEISDARRLAAFLADAADKLEEWQADYPRRRLAAFLADAKEQEQN